MDEDTTSLFKRRGPKKSSIRQKQTADLHNKTDSSSSISSSEEDGSRPIKRAKRRHVAAPLATSAKQNASTDETEVSKVSADRSANIEQSADATKRSSWHDRAKDEESRGLKRQKGPAKGSEALNENTYRGTANYQSFINRNPNAPAKQVGPMKAPTNIRTITVTDYSPDVCKDYKLTGFCGFGDGCIFLHSREDYKQGWQLDREWETVTQGKKVGGQIMSSRTKDATSYETEEEAALDGIPFACIICKESYQNPIVTRCGHYFCEDCALRRFRKTPNCAACGAGTGGAFNGARNLKKLLEAKRLRAEKDMADGDGVGEDDAEH